MYSTSLIARYIFQIFSLKSQTLQLPPLAFPFQFSGAQRIQIPPNRQPTSHRFAQPSQLSWQFVTSVACWLQSNDGDVKSARVFMNKNILIIFFVRI